MTKFLIILISLIFIRPVFAEDINLCELYAGFEVNFEDIDAELAILECKKAIEKYPNDLNYLTLLGRSYSADENYSEALKLFKLSAAQGHLEAMNYLGFMFQNGEGVEKDSIEAVKWWRKGAEQGNAHAQSSLGFMYENGEGVDQDYAEAFKWYRKAAKQGNAFGQNSLGYMFQHGEGVDQDYAKAFTWYRKAAKQGNAFGQNSLGYMFQHGEGVEQNYAVAFTWYHKAAEQGYAYAQDNLGFMYKNGKGVDQDYAEALKWYRKAAEQGHANAKWNIYIIHLKEDKIDCSKLQKIFDGIVASEENDLLVRIALQYKHGNRCVKTNHMKSFELMKKASDLLVNNSAALNWLGVMYSRGIGVLKDSKKSMEYHLKAIEIDNNDYSLNNIGYMYEVGEGVEVDFIEAAKWYKKAAKQNNYLAQASLGKFYLLGIGVDINYKEALKLFKLSAAQGDLEAMNFLGQIYSEGLGVDKDFNISLSWYVNAAKGNENYENHTEGSNVRIQKHLALNNIKRLKNLIKKEPQDKSNSPVDYGNYYALIIGNNNYLHLSRLNTAVNDAKYMAKVLQEDYGFTVKTLENASRSEIMGAVYVLRNKLKANDNLLIYYAGHGSLDEEIDVGYWHPIDSEEDNPSNWISVADISSQLIAFKAKHIMVIADSCYSGTLVRGLTPIKKTSLDEAWIKGLLKTKVRTAMSSGNYEVVSDAGGMDGHTWFTGSIIKVLKENKGILLGDQLFDKIKKVVQLNANQSPLYANMFAAGSEGGDFIFVKK